MSMTYLTMESTMLVNISIDDVSPHPKADYNQIKPAVEYILEHIPTAKFTFFVPTAYWRVSGNASTVAALKLSEHESFCNILADLPVDNFEYGYHGHYHGIPEKYTSNDEFKTLNYQEASSKIHKMRTEIQKTSLSGRISEIFRPPAWRCSSESLQALVDNGIKYFALAKETYALDTYGDFPAIYGDRIVWRTCHPPQSSIGPAEEKYVEVLYHSCNWDGNFFSLDRAKEFISWYTMYKYQYDLQFGFIEDLANV